MTDHVMINSLVTPSRRDTCHGLRMLDGENASPSSTKDRLCKFVDFSFCNTAPYKGEIEFVNVDFERRKQIR